MYPDKHYYISIMPLNAVKSAMLAKQKYKFCNKIPFQIILKIIKLKPEKYAA